MSHAPGNDDGFDVKQNRLDHPTGWMALTRYETVRFIIDALLESSPGHKFNKSELARRTGLSREAIRDRIDFLVEIGVVNELSQSGWAEYELNDDGRVTTELFQLNNAVNAVLSGQSKDLDGKRYKIPEFSRRFTSAPNIHGAKIVPYDVNLESKKSTVTSGGRLGMDQMKGGSLGGNLHEVA